VNVYVVVNLSFSMRFGHFHCCFSFAVTMAEEDEKFKGGGGSRPGHVQW